MTNIYQIVPNDDTDPIQELHWLAADYRDIKYSPKNVRWSLGWSVSNDMNDWVGICWEQHMMMMIMLVTTDTTQISVGGSSLFLIQLRTIYTNIKKVKQVIAKSGQNLGNIINNV